MILGNQVEWALHCMTVLASLPPTERVSTKTLAEFHKVPKEYLSKSLQLLSKEGLIDSTLGPNGGYCLALPASQISLLQIVEAVEGKQSSFQCTEIRKNNPCLKKGFPFSKTCLIAKAMYEADEAWRNSLRHKKLSHLAEELGEHLSEATKNSVAAWFSDQKS